MLRNSLLRHEMSRPLAGLPHEHDLPPLWDPEREGGDHEC